MAKDQKKVKLTKDDWDMLLPGDVLKIGNTTLDIMPVGLETLGPVLRRLKVISKQLVDDGITLQNFQRIDKLIPIASAILDQVPDVLEKTTPLGIEDIGKLPVSVGVQLLSKVLEVNITAQKDLIENFERLVEMLNQVGNRADQPKETIQS